MEHLKKLRVHLFVILGLVIINSIYFLPAFSGKVIQQEDIMHGVGKSKEIREFREEFGEEPLWTNSMFSGMPTFQISTRYPSNLFEKFERITKLYMPANIGLFITLMLGLFILLVSLKVNPWLAGIGALAFAYGAFFLISFSAGHNAKLRAAGYVAPTVMGVLLLMNGKRIAGAALTAFFLGLSISANHLQITYYSAFIVAFIVLTYLYFALKEKDLKNYFISVSILIGSVVLAVLPNTSKLWTTYEYSKETIRGGGSELKEKEAQGDGLDQGYAFDYSYSMVELFNMIIPNANGGGVKHNYEGTETYKLIEDNLKRQRQSTADVNSQVGYFLYWGNEKTTHGDYYLGAVMFFFFILAFLVAPKRMRIWVAASVVMSLFMALGKNFMFFNSILFDYFPLFNKFRVPSMALIICFVLIPGFGIYGVDRLLKIENRKDAEKLLLKAGYITGGVFLFFILLGPFLFSFDGPNDEQLENIIDVIYDDRKALMRNGAIRSLIFSAVAFGLLWLKLKDKIKPLVLFAALVVTVMIDLFILDVQHVKHDDFVTKRKYTSTFNPSKADQSILQANNPEYYRVLNMNNPFNDGFTSYHHKSIGGYHGAKIQRYQDLIEVQLSAEMQIIFDWFKNQNGSLEDLFKSTPALNMLNARYLIYNPEAEALFNPSVLGNAWFVKKLTEVENGDAELKAISEINPKNEALLKSEYFNQVDKKEYSGTGSIELQSYKANKLVYSSESNEDQFAVFSDVFYRNGKDWRVTIDGEPADHLRANYVLRAMKIPAGKHTIEFSFEPKSYYTGETISLIGSIIVVLLLLGALVKNQMDQKSEPTE
jgi:hypothetical protein